MSTRAVRDQFSVTAKIHAKRYSWLFRQRQHRGANHKIEQNPPIVQQGNTIRIWQD